MSCFIQPTVSAIFILLLFTTEKHQILTLEELEQNIWLFLPQMINWLSKYFLSISNSINELSISVLIQLISHES